MLLNFELCESWYHLKCTDLTEKAFKCITVNETKDGGQKRQTPNTGMRWFCEPCKNIQELINIK